MQPEHQTAKHEFEILIVDEDRELTSELIQILIQENFEPAVVRDSKSAMAIVQTRTFDLALVEMQLQDASGLRLVEKISRLSPRTDFILMTRDASFESAVQAVKQKNILSYEVKPLDIEHLMAFIRQIAERRRLEREVLGVSEDERRRFGHELHDSLGQLLTGAALQAKFLSDQLQSQGDAMSAVAGQLARLINQAITESSRMARGLAPISLEEKGLPAVLDELVNQTTITTGVACKISYSDEICLPDRNMRIHLYRIAQEAIQNAVKHSKANHINVQISRDKNYGYLEVTDDGLGLPENFTQRQGMGLKIMKYRANLLGGLLEVGSYENQGTRIRVCYREGYNHDTENQTTGR